MSAGHGSEAATVRRVHVPRRRIPVRLQLANGRSVAGEAYVAIAGAGAQERLLDRLNDESEHFLPVATAGRHLLVRKSAIVSAWTSDRGEVSAALEARHAREIPVEVATFGGSVIEGRLLAGTDRVTDRALDNLNQVVGPFVPLLARESITLVNTSHVVSVLEQQAVRTLD